MSTELAKSGEIIRDRGVLPARKPRSNLLRRFSFAATALAGLFASEAGTSGQTAQGKPDGDFRPASAANRAELREIQEKDTEQSRQERMERRREKARERRAQLEEEARRTVELLEGKRQLTREEIAETIEKLDSLIADLAEGLPRTRDALAEQHAFRDRHTAKYGTIEDPRLRIAPDYQPPPVQPARFTFLRPNKDAEYRDSVFKLYEATRLLRGNLNILRAIEGKLDADTLLPRSAELLKDHPHLEKVYVQPGGEEVHIDSPAKVAALAYSVAEVEMEFLGDKVTAFDVLSYVRDQKRLRELRPDLFAEGNDTKKVRELLDPALRRMLVGYPKIFSRLVIHPTEKEFHAHAEKEGGTADTAAYHSPLQDLIATHGEKNALEQLIHISHEAGHVVAQVSEHGSFQRLAEHEGTLKEFESERGNALKLRQFLTTLDAQEQFFLPLEETVRTGESVMIPGTGAKATYREGGQWVLELPDAIYRGMSPVVTGQCFCPSSAVRTADGWQYPLRIAPRSRVSVSVMNPEAHDERYQRAAQEIVEFRMNQMMLGFKLAAFSLKSTFAPDYTHTQLDEASAYLLQDLLLRELFRDHPEVLDLVSRARDFSNGTSKEDVKHTGAYLFAEEVLERHKGDSQAALSELAYLTDPEKLMEYGERIKALNESQGVSGGVLGDVVSLTKGFESFVEVSDRKVAVSEKTIALLTEKGEKRDDPAYPALVRERIADLDGKLAEGLKQFLAKIYAK